MIDDKNLRGTLGTNSHIDDPNPAFQKASEARQKMKKCLQENPRSKTSKIISEGREKTDNEVFVELGSDKAFNEYLRRYFLFLYYIIITLKKPLMLLLSERKNIYGNVNCQDPMEIELPKILIEKDGASVLIYDSRKVRANERDVVLVFAHPSVCFASFTYFTQTNKY